MCLVEKKLAAAGPLPLSQALLGIFDGSRGIRIMGKHQKRKGTSQDSQRDYVMTPCAATIAEDPKKRLRQRGRSVHPNY